MPVPEGSQLPHQPQAVHPGIPTNIPFNELYYRDSDDFDLCSDGSNPQLPSDPPMHSDFLSNIELYLGASQAFPGGKTFMDNFFADKYTSLRRDNLFYPFASQENWQLGSWLLRLGLSMAGIDSFLKLDLIKILTISFRSAKQLCLCAEMLPSDPLWKSLQICPPVATKRAVTLYYRDPIDCLQALLSHLFFEDHISFIPWKVWSIAARLVWLYNEWLTGDHAWELQSYLPPGSTLLGITLSSDKTNISVMSGNRMAHPLLVSLANIDTNIHSKGSLHSHLLLALLPVPLFIHPKSRVCSLLSDRLFHKCLDIVLGPFKVAASVGIMMNDPKGNLHYCYMPLIGYIADTPEQSLLACTSPKTSSVSTAAHKQFGDGIRHPCRTASKTLSNILAICSKYNLDDYGHFLNTAKSYGFNGVDQPFWINWPLSDPGRFLKTESLHHVHRFFFDHDLQRCIVVVGDTKIDYCFTLIRTLDAITGLCNATSLASSLARFLRSSSPLFVPLWIFATLLNCLALMNTHCSQLDTALQMFHDHKDSIITAGAHSSDHFHVPKLELLQHVVPVIWDSGAIMQWSADATEHAHVTEVKNPVCARNNQDYYSQIARHLNCTDKCFLFDIATCIASSLRLEAEHDEDEDDGEEHEPDGEVQNLLLYYFPTHKVVNYFQAACILVNGPCPGIPKPLRSFTSSTTAFHLALKPFLRLTIPEALELFRLPDLHNAICRYLDRCSSGEPHDVSEQRQPTSCVTLSDKMQIWTNIRVQLRTWRDPGSVEPVQTLVVAPPSAKYPSGCYDCGIVSPSADSDWPDSGLKGLQAFLSSLVDHADLKLQVI
ncbi:hypothetical protein OG21DRAFT_1489777 [Imleria badia]|nr:hypothetical protein OG21DRAFT_1489777 [Imleria badia]